MLHPRYCSPHLHAEGSSPLLSSRYLTLHAQALPCIPGAALSASHRLQRAAAEKLESGLRELEIMRVELSASRQNVEKAEYDKAKVMTGLEWGVGFDTRAEYDKANVIFVEINCVCRGWCFHFHFSKSLSIVVADPHFLRPGMLIGGHCWWGRGKACNMSMQRHSCGPCCACRALPTQLLSADNVRPWEQRAGSRGASISYGSKCHAEGS